MPKFRIIILTLIIFIFVSVPEIACADSFQDGVRAYSSGNYRYAENCFKRALQADPSNDVIKYYLAITLVQNKNNSDAIILYKNIIATSSNQDVINRCKAGLNLLGYSSSGSSVSVNKAILNVNAVGNILIVSNVNLNDRTKANFIFDTGASYVTISREIANRLGISTNNAPTMKIMTGSGYVYAPKVTLKKIEVNGLAAYNVETLITDLPIHSSGNTGNLAGLLGLSFMKDFKVTVDRRQSQITLERN